MNAIKRWMIIGLLIFTALPLVACGGSEASAKEKPAEVEPVAGSDFSTVTLTEKAAERLDIQSKPLNEESIDNSMKKVVPYAAVIYGLHGETWVYMRNPGPGSLTFVRTPITIERIEGDLAVLSDGPDIGAEIITVGVAELDGTETGVGK